MIFDFTKYGWPAMIDLVDFDKLKREEDKKNLQSLENKIIVPANSDICDVTSAVEPKR